MLSVFCQDDNPKTGLSLLQRKTLTPTPIAYKPLHLLTDVQTSRPITYHFLTQTSGSCQKGHGSQTRLSSFTLLPCTCFIFSLKCSSAPPSLLFMWIIFKIQLKWHVLLEAFLNTPLRHGFYSPLYAYGNPLCPLSAHIIFH